MKSGETYQIMMKDADVVFVDKDNNMVFQVARVLPMNWCQRFWGRIFPRYKDKFITHVKGFEQKYKGNGAYELNILDESYDLYKGEGKTQTCITESDL